MLFFHPPSTSKTNIFHKNHSLNKLFNRLLSERFSTSYSELFLRHPKMHEEGEEEEEEDQVKTETFKKPAACSRHCRIRGGGGRRG